MKKRRVRKHYKDYFKKITDLETELDDLLHKYGENSSTLQIYTFKHTMPVFKLGLLILHIQEISIGFNNRVLVAGIYEERVPMYWGMTVFNIIRKCHWSQFDVSYQYPKYEFLIDAIKKDQE